jgi:predicted nucleic acid-binding protein
MSKPRLYIDSCCFIDAAKHKVNAALSNDRLNDVWFIQQCLKASEAHDIEVVTSTLTIAECTSAGGDISAEVKRLFRSVLTSGKVVTLAQVTLGIAERARDLRWIHKVNLKGADAIHVATALTLQCTEFFSTDNRGPHKNATALQTLGLRVIRASDTLLLPDDYRQHKLLPPPPPESAESDS